MGKTRKTTSNSTTVTTPSNPQWVTDAVQTQTGRVNALAGADPYSFVAGPSALQKQQFGMAGGLGTQGLDWLNQSAATAGRVGSYTPQQVQAQGVAPGQAFASLGAADPTNALSGILSGRPDNPYLASINQANINQSLQGYQDAVGSAVKSLSRQVLPGIRSGGMLAGQYGGSRQGIAEGVAMGDVGTQLAQNARNLSQSAMDSGNKLYGQAYESAQDRMAQTANTLATAGLQNAQFNAGQNMTAQQANQSAGLQGQRLNLDAAQYLGGQGQFGVNYLGQAGAAQQGLDQAQAQAPLNLLQATNAAYGQLPYNLFNGSTVNQTGASKETEGGLGTYAEFFQSALKQAAAKMAGKL